jgi:hypothetical protein
VPTPTQAVPDQIKIRFTKSLQLLLSERLLRRNLSVEKYIAELIENDVAELRLERWRATTVQKRNEEKVEVPARRAKSAERARLILELLEDGVYPSAVAERTHVSLNTVHRIKREHTGD